MKRFPQISASRRIAIQTSARDFLYRLRVSEGKPRADQFYPIKIDRVVHELCGFRVEEIENQTVAVSDAQRIIGLINRPTATIGVSASIPISQRRFTLAHEVGHLALHPQLNQHREQLFDESQRRAPAEIEADLFAVEMLLPRNAVVERFRSIFGENIDRAQIGELNLSNLAHIGFKLRHSGNSELRRFSIALSSSHRWGWAHFRNIAEYFGVSPLTIAIRLEELLLVR